MARYIMTLLLALVPGCFLLSTPEPPPAVEFDLYDQPVTCDPATGRCEASGAVVAGEPHRTKVHLRELPASAGYPRGVLLTTIRLLRPSGNQVQLTLEVPVDTGAAAGPPRMSYQEWRGAEQVFSSARVSGRIELSWDGSCPCQTGRFELVFTDPGPDGVMDTADDAVRRLSRARLRRGSRPFCHGRSVLSIKEDILVVGSRSCPTRGSGGWGAGGACAWSGSGWLEGWNDDGWYDEEWVGDYGDYDEDYDDGWCEEWTEECVDCGWSDSGWGDDGWGDEGGGGGGSSGSTGGGGGDDGWDDDWGGDDDWGDDDWWDDGGGDDWGDDDWGDDDDWWDD